MDETSWLWSCLPICYRSIPVEVCHGHFGLERMFGCFALVDLDTETRELCNELGINMIRAATVGTHPRFVRMIRELVEERMTDSATQLALGSLGPSHDVCPDDCCLFTPSQKNPPQVSNDRSR